MKKSINKFALTIWGFSILIVILHVISTVIEIQNLHVHGMENMQSSIIVDQIVSTFGPFAQLVGLGAIIELIDQIRWTAIHRQIGP